MHEEGSFSLKIKASIKVKIKININHLQMFTQSEPSLCVKCVSEVKISYLILVLLPLTEMTFED